MHAAAQEPAESMPIVRDTVETVQIRAVLVTAVASQPWNLGEVTSEL